MIAERLTGWERADPGSAAAGPSEEGAVAAGSAAAGTPGEGAVAGSAAAGPSREGAVAAGSAAAGTPGKDAAGWRGPLEGLPAEDTQPGWALTPEQEQAVARRGEPLLVAAGAGSGKTAVLVERFVRAVREDGIAPERILAITFTERAAGELRERVRARLTALGEQGAARRMERAYVGTFHGFCARVLRAHARAAGVGEEHAILDEGLAGRLRRRAFAQALGGFVQDGRTEAVDLIAAYTADRARATVLGVYAELRSRGQREPRLPEPRFPEPRLPHPALGGRPDATEVEGARVVALWDELLRRFVTSYEAAKRAREGLDFDDLELIAGELLARDADIRRVWRERFELLMVDELQDVNPRQLALVEALERENLFTVGDEWQSIYGFRHADVGLFRAREGRLRPRGQSLRLTYNFRGRPELLQVVNAVFARRFGDAFTPLRAGRRREGGGEHQSEGERSERGSGGEGEREDERGARSEPRVELLLTDRRGWGTHGLGVGGSPGRGESAVVSKSPGTGEASSEGESSGVSRAGEASDLAGGSWSAAAGWREAEARALAGRVAELVRDGRARPGGVAVLLRGMGDVDCYERALREQGLRTVASAGAFWERQEIADLLAHLRALADPRDELALYGALACPPACLGSDALALLARAAREQGRSVWEVVRELGPRGPGDGERTGPKDDEHASGAHAPAAPNDLGGAGVRGMDDHLGGDERVRAAGLCAWLQRARELRDELTMAQLVEHTIARCDPAAGPWARPQAHEAHEAHEDTGRRHANVRKLAGLAGEWERSEGNDLPGFLEEAAFQAGAGGGYLANAEVTAEPDAPVAAGAREAVALMSVHAAKGLEFDVVCVADLGRAPGMGVPDLLVDDGRVGVRLVGLADPEPRPALGYEELANERRAAQADEEDRIVYVAMTRARERLLLSGAVDFASWPRERPGAPPIAWLGPALAPKLPALCADLARECAPAPGASGLPARRVEVARESEESALEAPALDVSTLPTRGAEVACEPAATLSAPALTVEGTDVPLRCRLNTRWVA